MFCFHFFGLFTKPPPPPPPPPSSVFLRFIFPFIFEFFFFFQHTQTHTCVWKILILLATSPSLSQRQSNVSELVKCLSWVSDIPEQLAHASPYSTSSSACCTRVKHFEWLYRVFLYILSLQHLPACLDVVAVAVAADILWALLSAWQIYVAYRPRAANTPAPSPLHDVYPLLGAAA